MFQRREQWPAVPATTRKVPTDYLALLLQDEGTSSTQGYRKRYLMLKKKIKRMEEALDVKDGQIAQLNKDLSDSRSSTQSLESQVQIVSNLSEEAKIDLRIKKLESEMEYAKRKAAQTAQSLEKQLQEEQKSKNAIEQANKTLTNEVEVLKSKIHTVMNADVKEAQDRFNSELRASKEASNAEISDLKSRLEQEQKQRKEIEKVADTMQKERDDAAIRLQEYKVAGGTSSDIYGAHFGQRSISPK